VSREAKRLTKAALDALRRRAQGDRGFTAFVADARQPGLYAWARRGKVRFVFAYRPPGGGRRRRLSIDEYGGIDLTTARKIARQHRNLVAEGKDPEQEGRKEARRATTVGEALDLYLEDFRLSAVTPFPPALWPVQATAPASLAATRRSWPCAFSR
jgi:hypothetical protein